MGIREASRPPRSGQHPPRLGTRGKLATVASRRSGPDTRPHTTPKSEPRRRAFPLCNVSSIQCVRALVCPQNPGQCPSPAWATSQNESDGCVTAAAPSRQGTSGGPSERQASAAGREAPTCPSQSSGSVGASTGGFPCVGLTCMGVHLCRVDPWRRLPARVDSVPVGVRVRCAPTTEPCECPCGREQ